MLQCVIVSCVGLTLTWTAASAQDSLSTLSTPELFARGYATIAEAPGGALIYFEEITRREPANLLALRQLGSLYVVLDRPAEALEVFRKVNEISPNDTTRLQIAYLLAGSGDQASALAEFRALSASKDMEIRNNALRSRVVLEAMECQSTFPWWMRAQASPYYEGRIRDLILPANFYAGRYLTDDRVLSAYGVASVIWDTRSRGGALPVIYSDNYVLAGIGFRVQPVTGLSADVQGGLAVDLNERPERNRVREDFRAVAVYGWGIYPDVALPPSLRWNPAFLLDTYLSAGYYSRYENFIAYGQVRPGARLFSWRASSLEAYGRLNAVADSRGDFYNNVLEGGCGLRFTPDYRFGLSFLAEYLWGTYWRSGQQENPYGKHYDTVRLFITFDRWLCW